MITDLIQLIPEQLRTQPFYVKIIEVVNHILAEREDEFNDIYSKFRDFDQLHEEALQALIDEFGYTYITDILELSIEQIRTLSTFLFLIHAMKGQKSGFELVLDLLAVIDYTLTEWWEKTPKGTPDTYDFVGYVDLAEVSYEDASSIINTKLQEFARAYVYPLYELWDLRGVIRVDSEVPKIAAFLIGGLNVFVEPYLIDGGVDDIEV